LTQHNHDLYCPKQVNTNLKGTNMKALFKFLTGDCNWSDYGGKFYRKVGIKRFHIMDVINWIEATGDDSGFKYRVSLSEVDLRALPVNQLERAKRSCGWETEPPEFFTEKLTLDMVHSYMGGVPLGEYMGNNLNKLMKQARATSADLDDPDQYETAMNRVVNGIGSTAREYGQGDFNSAMVRAGFGSPVAQTSTLGPHTGIQAQIVTDTVPSDDPLAYMMGYMRALAGSGLEEETDLAPAYIEGFRFGVSVKSGETTRPDWHK
jgi:hypothetical protein